MSSFKTDHQVKYVANFKNLISTTFHGETNTCCWSRELIGDFSEIVDKAELNENIIELKPKELLQLELSKQGNLAREIILNDLKALKNHGASPTLNVIKHYERDDDSFFPTDVYSFHVDRSPIPTSTFLCTYFGEPSEILPNLQAKQKVLIPEIRKELKKLHDGSEDEFESFLSDYFFDLHYQALPNTKLINLGLGNLWKIAVDYPNSNSIPCIHRAPKEKNRQKRLLLIC